MHRIRLEINLSWEMKHFIFVMQKKSNSALTKVLHE